MQSTFLDTSYIIALEISDDQYHSAAQKHWQTLIRSPFALVTTSYVFTEIVTFFNSRNLHAKAVEVGQRLQQSSKVQVVFVDETMFALGWNYFQRYSDKTCFLTDCISFVVMQQKNIQVALTFDRHFLQAGFRIQP